jgi:hypothetical protein
MAVEKIELTDWTSKEYEVDRVWIDENLTVLQPFAISEFDEIGPGAIFVNTTEYDEDESRHPCYYMPQAIIEELENEETKRIVREYDPHQEFVIILVKAGERECTHQINFQKKE